MPRNKRKIVDDQSSVLAFFAEWLACLAAGGTALAIGSDLLIRGSTPTPAGLVAASMLVIGYVRFFWTSQKTGSTDSPARQLESPLLLLVFSLTNDIFLNGALLGTANTINIVFALTVLLMAI